MIFLAGDIKSVLWVAVVPAFLAVLLLIVAVREPNRAEPTATQENFLTFAKVKQLPLRYWQIIALGAVFTLARFSEAFLILRAQDIGLGIAYVPAIMIVMNIVYAVFAYPAGTAADRLPARTLLVLGLGVLIVADILLVIATSPSVVFLGAAFWGLHMALTQGLLSKLVADTSPLELRGTAFGIFNLVSGVTLLLASVLAGFLWGAYGASATFIAGASFAALAAMGLLLYRPSRG
jgi:MFS family permease